MRTLKGRPARVGWFTLAGAAALWLAGLAVSAAQAPVGRPIARAAASSAGGGHDGWAGYGGGPEQIRYSSLTAINRANVKQLGVAWTYDTGELGDLQTQPIVVNGVLYGYTPTHTTFAVERGHRTKVVDLRFRRERQRPQSRLHVLGGRRRTAAVRRR